MATELSKIPFWGVGREIGTCRNILFFEGMFTLIVGLAAPFFMPDRPENCHFLTPRERIVAAERLAREHKGVGIFPSSFVPIYLLHLVGLQRESNTQTHPNGHLQYPHYNLCPRLPLRKRLRPIDFPLHAYHPERHGVYNHPSPAPLCPSLRHCLRSIDCCGLRERSYEEKGCLPRWLRNSIRDLIRLIAKSWHQEFRRQIFCNLSGSDGCISWRSWILELDHE